MAFRSPDVCSASCLEDSAIPQIRQYPQATQLLLSDAFVIDRVGTGTMYINAQASIPTSLIWAGSMFYEGSSPPASSQFLGGWNLPVAVTMPADNATALSYGWGFHVESTTLPTSTFIINIAKNDVLAATITVLTNGTWTYTAASGAWTLAIRDRVTAIAPSGTDATMNNFFLTMVGLIT